MSLNTWMICGLALYVIFVVYVGFFAGNKTLSDENCFDIIKVYDGGTGHVGHLMR